MVEDRCVGHRCLKSEKWYRWGGGSHTISRSINNLSELDSVLHADCKTRFLSASAVRRIYNREHLYSAHHMLTTDAYILIHVLPWILPDRHCYYHSHSTGEIEIYKLT